VCANEGHQSNNPAPVAQPAREKFKLTHQPLEAALFFIALGKKSMLLALCKSIQDTKLTTFFAYAPGNAGLGFDACPSPANLLLFFFVVLMSHLGLAKRRSNDFSEERWQTAASKNAYVLMGRQQFMQVRRANKHGRPTLSPWGWVRGWVRCAVAGCPAMELCKALSSCALLDEVSPL
jgi:hypothetical protein